MFAVISRLKDSKHEGLSLISKMRLYNKEDVEGFSQSDVPLLKNEFDKKKFRSFDPFKNEKYQIGKKYNIFFSCEKIV